jgi:two-component system, cell cycle sensor histidine kinase and response regulator CckA
MPTALIVDDNAENRYFLECLLGAEGYRVVGATNGQEALEVAKHQPIALVVSDVLMPVMDGFSLCRLMKSDDQLRHIPFVVYTATYTDPKDEEFALSLGADRFIVKPTDPEELRTRLREVVERQKSGRLGRDSGEPLGERPYLQQYNEVLIRKLEQKVLELEQVNQELCVKDLAIASSADGIVLCDLVGSITYANPTIGRWCGKPASELLGRRFDEVVASTDPGGLGDGRFEATLVQQTGTTRWLRVAVHQVASEDGQPRGSMCTCQDVSEERRLRQELSRIRQLESLGVFAGGVAHDFNNLLMSIFGALELESLPGVSRRESAEYRAMAMAGYERARDLTRRLLAFSKAGSADRCSVDLHQLLDETIALSLSGSGIRCEKRYSSGNAVVCADPGQLSRVFSNILVNARQAMNDRGTMLVTVEAEPREPRGSRTTCDVVVRLTDSGPGIAPEVLPRVFDPYFTTKPEGSGLGLPTSQAIVLEHGGTIQVSSPPGEGATFEVRLPSSREGGPVRRKSLESEAPTRCSGRILLMDDRVAIQALTQRSLERSGYSVVVVGNGEQALLELARAREAQLPFDLAILDVTVQGGMGAVETLPRIRETDPEVLVMASTGYADQERTTQLLLLGFATVLAKPYLMHELLSRVGSVMASRGA